MYASWCALFALFAHAAALDGLLPPRPQLNLFASALTSIEAAAAAHPSATQEQKQQSDARRLGFSLPDDDYADTYFQLGEDFILMSDLQAPYGACAGSGFARCRTDADCRDDLPPLLQRYFEEGHPFSYMGEGTHDPEFIWRGVYDPDALKCYHAPTTPPDASSSSNVRQRRLFGGIGPSACSGYCFYLPGNPPCQLECPDYGHALALMESGKVDWSAPNAACDIYGMAGSDRCVEACDGRGEASLSEPYKRHSASPRELANWARATCDFPSGMCSATQALQWVPGDEEGPLCSTERLDSGQIEGDACFEYILSNLPQYSGWVYNFYVWQFQYGEWPSVADLLPLFESLTYLVRAWRCGDCVDTDWNDENSRSWGSGFPPQSICDGYFADRPNPGMCTEASIKFWQAVLYFGDVEGPLRVDEFPSQMWDQMNCGSGAGKNGPLCEKLFVRPDEEKDKLPRSTPWEDVRALICDSNN